LKRKISFACSPLSFVPFAKAQHRIK